MDIFSTATLNRVVAYLPATPLGFLVNRFFPLEQIETTEEIHFDVASGKRRIAPFVSPLVQGKIVEERGFTTKTFRPAYVKPKTVFDPMRPFRRSIGERIGGSLSPQERMDRAVAATLQDHIEMVGNRLEAMASEALRTGKITVKGELYPTVVVDFGRDAALTIVLSGGAKWDQVGVSLIGGLETWASLVMSKSGATSVDVVMATNVWSLFRTDAEVEKQLDRTPPTTDLDVAGIIGEGGVYKGTINNFRIWVYSGSYYDEDGAEQQLMPPGTVIMAGAQMEGTQAFGAIRDEEAGFQALRYFSKSWLEKDPSVRFLMTQSAPLLVPYRPNASLCATVL